MGQPIQYHLEQYADNADTLKVSIHLSEPVKGPLYFVMPRSSLGSYGVVFYDKYVQQLEAFDGQGVKIGLSKLPDGPRWRIGNDSGKIQTIRYKISLAQLEAGVEPSNASKKRPGYTSILNYSVLGYLQGLENTPVSFTVATSAGWQVFSTLEPSADEHFGSLAVEVPNYALLADAQTVIGNQFRLKLFKNAPVPLYVLLYSETNTDIDLIGNGGVFALQNLKDYFDTIPFNSYTIIQEYLAPKYADKTLGFTMEHSTSLTGF